jgi:hypothetical protein
MTNALDILQGAVNVLGDQELHHQVEEIESQQGHVLVETVHQRSEKTI